MRFPVDSPVENSCPQRLLSATLLAQHTSFSFNTHYLVMRYRLLFFLLGFVSFACDNDSDPGPATGDTCTRTETERAILADLNTLYARPFDPVDPATPDLQLDRLVEYLGAAELVGLGESTHGTAEFFQMKDQLFRALVTQQDFRSIIFELPWGHALTVNDFVTKGIGTANSTVNETYFWVYDTQEVRDLAQWMRDYNLAHPDTPIFFVGCDSQGPNFRLERRILNNFLWVAQPDSLDAVDQYYQLLPGNNLEQYRTATNSTHEANIAGTAAVVDYFEANRAELVAATTLLEYEIAAMAARVIQQREQLYRTGDFGSLRDAHMAENARRWQQILGKSAIWAHNFHVMNLSGTMGEVLRLSYGDDYRILCFSTSSGNANAWVADANFNIKSGVERQAIPLVPCQTTQRLLNEVEGDRHFLIFDDLSGPARDYFGKRNPFFQFGSGFNGSLIQQFIQPYNLRLVSDALVHFDRTKASALR